ncbi:MAG: PD-(D/E)XK nuclease family protein, partial [Ilumatobacter sp.]
TVHGAKGLEFPITILAGMTTQASSARRGVSVVWNDDGTPEVRVRKDVATLEHEPRADLEAEMGHHEKLRLLYVAATRARDHLLVSGHHKASFDERATFATRLGLFAEARPELVRPFEAVVREVASPTDDDAPRGPGHAVESDRHNRSASAHARAVWVARRAELLRRHSAPTTLSATAIAATVDASIVDVDDDTRSAPPEADDDDPARPLRRRRGRAGSAIGSAVHATLEVVDFGEPGDLRPLIERQCHVESIPEHADTVELLVRSALGAPAIELAARHRHEREMYVAVPLGDVVVEGYIDLLVHGPDGLVVVDYKTDTVTNDLEIDAKVATYELQAATYAVALELATGLTVAECRFVFCAAGDAIERSVGDLRSVMDRVRRTVLEVTAP